MSRNSSEKAKRTLPRTRRLLVEPLEERAAPTDLSSIAMDLKLPDYLLWGVEHVVRLQDKRQRFLCLQCAETARNPSRGFSFFRAILRSIIDGREQDANGAER